MAQLVAAEIQSDGHGLQSRQRHGGGGVTAGADHRLMHFWVGVGIAALYALIIFLIQLNPSASG
jgi:tetrahydromethanopterin S-methyltransferase subunit B